MSWSVPFNRERSSDSDLSLKRVGEENRRAVQR